MKTGTHRKHEEIENALVILSGFSAYSTAKSSPMTMSCKDGVRIETIELYVYSPKPRHD
jgi:hypothetical protein